MYSYDEVRGKNVFFSGDGKEGGAIKEIYIDPVELRISGFSLEREGKKFLPYERIEYFEKDAAMADSSSGLRDLRTDNLVGGHTVRGQTIVTEKGKTLGRIVSFYFEKDGTISYYTVSEGIFRDIADGHRLLPGECVKVLGPDAFIVDDEVENIVKEIKEGGAIEAASKLADSFKEKIQKFRKKMESEAKASGRHGKNKLSEMKAKTKKTSEKFKKETEAKSEEIRKKGKKAGERIENRMEEARDEAKLKARKTGRKSSEKTRDYAEKVKKFAGESRKKTKKTAEKAGKSIQKGIKKAGKKLKG